MVQQQQQMQVCNRAPAAAIASSRRSYLYLILLLLRLLWLRKRHDHQIAQTSWTRAAQLTSHMFVWCSFVCVRVCLSFYFYLRWALYSNGVAPLICPVELRWKWTFCHLPSRLFQTRVSSDWFVCALPSLCCVCVCVDACVVAALKIQNKNDGRERKEEMNSWKIRATLIKAMCNVRIHTDVDKRKKNKICIF